VHFGGLSEHYGLGSDNLLGATVITAAGLKVQVSAANCTVTGYDRHRSATSLVISSSECDDLWYGMRGAGSHFGIVTSLTIRIYPKKMRHDTDPVTQTQIDRAPSPSVVQPSPPAAFDIDNEMKHQSHYPTAGGVLYSALSVLTLSVHDPARAAECLYSYLSAVPPQVTLTMYTLDAYFKAYTFVQLFGNDRWSALNYKHWLGDLLFAHSSNKKPSKQSRADDRGHNATDMGSADADSDFVFVHLLLEVSWLSNVNIPENTDTEEYTSCDSFPSAPRDKWSFSSRGREQGIHAHPVFRLLQDIHRNGNNESSGCLRCTSDTGVKFRPWISSPDTWAVESYDVVWGTGHAYAGASIAVDKGQSVKVLTELLREYQDMVAPDRKQVHRSCVDNIGNESMSCRVQQQRKQKPCSDCVLVIHRVGEGIRYGGRLNHMLADEQRQDQAERDRKINREQNDRVESNGVEGHEEPGRCRNRRIDYCRIVQNVIMYSVKQSLLDSYRYLWLIFSLLFLLLWPLYCVSDGEEVIS